MVASRRAGGIRLALTLAVGLWLGALAVGSATARAATEPGGDLANPAILAIDLARPAVARLYAAYPVTLTARLCVATSETLRGTVAATGTGAFISATGDLLTADHVVNLPRADLDQATLSIFADQLARDLGAKCGVVTTAAATYAAYAANPTLFQTIYGAPDRRVWLGTAYAGAYPQASVSDAPSYPLTVLAESDTSQNDLALAHIALTDTPAIALDPLADVAPTDTVTIVGFPGNGDVSAKPANFLTDSINPVTVSALKTADTGATLIQVGGNVEHGDSGGPALNAAGQIVGVVSFALAETGETRFLQAATSALPLVRQAGISLAPGAFQTRWRAALTAFAATTPGHWRVAAADLAALARDYPRFQGGAPYLAYATAQAATERVGGDPAAWPWLPLVGLAGSALAALALAVLCARALRRRRVRRGRRHPLRLGPAPGYVMEMTRPVPAPARPPPAISLATKARPWPEPDGAATRPVPVAVAPRWAAAAPDVTAPRRWPATPLPARCPHGHSLAPNASFCPRCGVPRR